MLKLLKPKNAVYHLHSSIEQIDFANLEQNRVHYFANIQPYEDMPLTAHDPKELIALGIDQYYEDQSERYISHYRFNFPFALGYLKGVDRDKLYQHNINHFWRHAGLGPLLAGEYIVGSDVPLQEVLLAGTFVCEFRRALLMNSDLYDSLFRLSSDRMAGEYALEHYAIRITQEFEMRRWIPYGQKCSVGFANHPKHGRGISYRTQNMHIHLIWDWRNKTFYVHTNEPTWTLLSSVVTFEQIGESEIIMGDPVARALELTEKFGPDIVVLPHHIGGYHKLIVEFKFIKPESTDDQAI